MQIAILGLPQAGKRTLFTLLTGRAIPRGRKPAESLSGIAPIRDPRVTVLAELFRPRKTTPAENQFLLCPDVTDGPGKRDWLTAARKCDLLCLVVRAFASEQVYHPAGSVDPERDRQELTTELILADLELVLNRLLRIEKEQRAGCTTALAIEEQALRRCVEALEREELLRDVPLDDDQQAAVKSLGLVTRIPFLWCYNVTEDELDHTRDKQTFTVSCQIEQEIAAIEDDDERREFLNALGVTATGLDRMNQAAYEALGLMSFYTTGQDEVRAWTIRRGSPAPRAGGKIHSDIERGFIRVEILKYDDLIAAGSEKTARDAGKIQTKGKDYVIEDGDTCHFLFSV